MTPPADDLRNALRHPAARTLVIDMERRGIAFRLFAGRVQVRPARLLTDADRAGLRAARDAVHVLIAHRDAWSDWWQRPCPPFDASHAFLRADDPRRPS